MLKINDLLVPSLEGKGREGALKLLYSKFPHGNIAYLRLIVLARRSVGRGDSGKKLKFRNCKGILKNFFAFFSVLDCFLQVHLLS